MDAICIISCGAAKIWNKDPGAKEFLQAKDAYVGSLFRKTREYAERFFPDCWYILSDKYGLIRPDDLIRNYEISPEEIKNSELFRLLVDFQARSLCIIRIPKVVTTAGSVHHAVITKIFTESKIQNPLLGMSQGKRMQALKTMCRGIP